MASDPAVDCAYCHGARLVGWSGAGPILCPECSRGQDAFEVITRAWREQRAEVRRLRAALDAARAEEREQLTEQSEFWRRAHLSWQSWAEDLLRDLGRQPLHGLTGDEGARDVLASLARLAPPVPRCSRCGCFATRHEVDGEELRECADCECTQWES